MYNNYKGTFEYNSQKSSWILMFELIMLGVVTGVLSGFFGIGGGTILVPLLLLLGYDIKIAIGISVMQMLFSSIFGSYLNNKKGTLDIMMVSTIGIGGFVGAQLSGIITSNFSDKFLETIFLGFALFALTRLFITPKEHSGKKEVNRILLFILGMIIGTFSMSIGVGGSLVLVPILVGFLHISLKEATSAGLFFVVFSSISGFISHAIHENIDYESGLFIGAASLIGVYFGVHLKHIVNSAIQKILLSIFYFMVVLYLTYRIFAF